MNIKIKGWKVTIHNENGDRLELNGEFEADFFKEYERKQLITADVSNRYSIEDIEKCVENWGICKVEKEYIERFLNGC